MIRLACVVCLFVGLFIGTMLTIQPDPVTPERYLPDQVYVPWTVRMELMLRLGKDINDINEGMWVDREFATLCKPVLLESAHRDRSVEEAVFIDMLSML